MLLKMYKNKMVADFVMVDFSVLMHVIHVDSSLLIDLPNDGFYYGTFAFHIVVDHIASLRYIYVVQSRHRAVFWRESDKWGEIMIVDCVRF